MPCGPLCGPITTGRRAAHPSGPLLPRAWPACGARTRRPWSTGQHGRGCARPRRGTRAMSAMTITIKAMISGGMAPRYCTGGAGGQASGSPDLSPQSGLCLASAWRPGCGGVRSPCGSGRPTQRPCHSLCSQRRRLLRPRAMNTNTPTGTATMTAIRISSGGIVTPWSRQGPRTPERRDSQGLRSRQGRARRGVPSVRLSLRSVSVGAATMPGCANLSELSAGNARVIHRS